MAARLFSIETYLSLAAAAVMLAAATRASFKTLYAAALLLSVNEWLLKPVMEQARTAGTALGLGFGPWHGISALLYLAACALALVLIWNDDLR